MKKELGRLLAIQMLLTALAAALAVMVPLYLLDQKIDITWIGIILALGPLSFLIIRIAFATIADEIGTKHIAVLYSFSNAVSILFYMFIISPLGFAAATLAEGVRTSGFWAIARTEILDANGKEYPGHSLAFFSNMRQLADGLGRLAAGAILAYLAFHGAFLVLFFFSLVLFALIITHKERGAGVPHLGAKNLKMIFDERPKEFWQASFLQVLMWLPINMLFVFLIPVYLSSSLHLQNFEIGIILALFSLATAGFAILFMKFKVSKMLLLAIALVAALALAIFPFYGIGALPLLILLAAGGGSVTIYGEYLLTEHVYKSSHISTDIGMTYAPLKFGEFLFLCSAGFIIANFGFVPLFALLAISMALFCVLGSE